MRRLLVAILLATTAATSAPAQSRADERRAEREAARAEREAAHAARGERATEARPERPPREERQADRSQPSLETATVGAERGYLPRADAPNRAVLDRAAERGRPSTQIDGEDRDRSGRPALQHRRDDGDSVADWRRDQRDRVREAREARVTDRRERVADRQDRAGQWARPPRVTPPPSAHPNAPAPPPPTASQNAPAPKWATHWRGDHRYDWRDYRRRHRALFHLGFYFDPFGWNYNRWSIGWRLWPSYYHRSYWLHDPWMYRLPYAPYPYKWVRYWNDALLVDTFTGRVVDVEYDFFW